MLAATIIPYAAVGTDRYIELILLRSLFVGLIQLLIGVFKLGVVLDFISSTVILAITQAVAIILFVSAFFSMCLTGVSAEGNIFNKIRVLYENSYDLNVGTLIVGTLTLATGLLCKIIVPDYYLLVAMIAGTLVTIFLSKSGYELADNIPLLGAFPLTYDIWHLPVFDRTSISIISSQWENAFAIAFLGLMQTVIISRSIAVKSGETIVTNREVIGQGLANTIAPFCSSFSGSGSFNRSATNHQLGAKSLYAGVFGVFLLIIIVVFGKKLSGYHSNCRY